MPDQRIEQRTRLRAEALPPDTTLIVRGGQDTLEKLRNHAQRTARAWCLDGQPLFGVSVFAVVGISLDELLRKRFATFRAIYTPRAGHLYRQGFELLPTGQQPHYTVRLPGSDDPDLRRLLTALGAPQQNPEYARSAIWRKEG